MDALTHAVVGASLALAVSPRRPVLSVRERVGLGAVAGAFPDVDFLLFPLAPLTFLAEWHQGPTHSLVLLPLWAALLAGLFRAVTRRAGSFGPALWISALAIAAHIAADLITAYGTALAYPLSTRRWSLGVTYVIDPVFTTVVVVGLVISLRTGRRAPAWLAFGTLLLYVMAQVGWQQRALDQGRASAQAQGFDADRWLAFAQPFSPFNWKVVGVDDSPDGGQRYLEAHLNVAGHRPVVPSWFHLRRWHDLAAAYRGPAEAIWRQIPQFGDASDRELTEALWHDPRFEPFRRFAVLPSVSRIDSSGAERCVWFTDRRYDLPTLPDTFRYGFCQDEAGGPWRLYRLRYFSEGSRQRLNSSLIPLPPIHHVPSDPRDVRRLAARDLFDDRGDLHFRRARVLPPAQPQAGLQAQRDLVLHVRQLHAATQCQSSRAPTDLPSN